MKLKRLIPLSALALALTTPAWAFSVPTFVINKNNEIQQLIETLMQNQWARNVLYSLKDVQSLLALKDSASQIGQLVSALKEEANIAKWGSALVKNKLSGLNVEQFISPLRDAGGTITLDKVKGGVDNLLASLPPRETSSLLSSITEPIDKAKVFIQEGTQFLRDGKAHTRSQMEELWAKEGQGAYKSGDTYHYTPTGSLNTGHSGASQYMKELLTSTPLVTPGVMQAYSEGIITSTKGQYSTNRDRVTLQVADAEKVKALTALGAISAKYYDSDKGYQASVNKSLEQYNDAMAKASDLANKTAPGEAIQAIAGLLATQIQQNQTNNMTLLATNKALADEIKILDLATRMQLESYSKDLYNNLLERGRLHEVELGKQY